jgi:putative transposase
MSTKLSAGRVRSTYEFIKANHEQYSVQAMCRILGVAASGYYEWLTHPVSNRAQEDARLLRLIRASFTASQGIYGAPRIFLDLREAGETCSKHRVARLMRVNQLRALHGYRTRRWSVGKPSVLIPNLLKRGCPVACWNSAAAQLTTMRPSLLPSSRVRVVDHALGAPQQASAFPCGPSIAGSL